MKKQLLLILLLILQSLAIFIPNNSVSAAENPEGYIIEGDSVIWENNWARLEVYPHTSYNILIQVQYANLTWKLADNDIDVAFRFDTPITNGKIWRKSGDNWVPVSMYLTEYNDKYYYRHDDFHVVQDGFYQFKWRYTMPFNTSGKWELLAKLSSDTIQEAYSSGRYIMLDPWWNTSWAYYKPITINNVYIDTPLQDFPVLVVVNQTLGALCDGGDSIRFLSIDNVTEFYYEIEANWSHTGNSYIWVNISEQIPSGSDYTFLMYYGNSDASDNQNPANVWNSSYAMVQHLNGSSATACDDSTTNNVDVGSDGGTPDYQQRGIVGYCVYFDGNNEYLNFSDPSWTHSTGTIEFWQRIPDNALYGPIGISDGDTTKNYLQLYNNGDAFSTVLTGAGALFSFSNALTIDDTWQYIVISQDGATSRNYFDGDVQANTGSGEWLDDLTGVTDYIIGGVIYNTNLANDMKGYVDEVRVSNVARNATWIKASFHTMNQTPGFITFGSVEYSPVGVKTNTTTGIELTNATARGYFFGPKFSGNYNYGFWIGQTSPVTDANAEQNVTGAGTITAPSTFNYNIISLSKGTHYYVRAWVSNATYFNASSSPVSFYTKCNAPTGFTATASGCNAELAWTKGDGAAKTTIVRKIDSYPLNLADGTVIYNDIDSSYSDTTGSGSHQYYRAWSWMGDKYSDNNVSANLSVPPCPPTNIDGEILINKTLNITWTRGTGANTTLIIRKIDLFPSSRTDGTEIYNNTGTHFVETDLTQEYFYKLWSYANNTYSSSVEFEYGALVVSCYDEETNESIDFDILVNNEDGTETYESLNNINPLVINVDDLPLGDNIRIQISVTSSVINKTQIFSGFANDTNLTITQVILLQEPNSKSSTNVTTTNITSGINSYPQFTVDEDIITIPANAVPEFNQITITYQHDEYEPRTYFKDFIANHVYILDAYLPNADDSELYRIIVKDDFGNTVNDALVTAKVSIGGVFVIASIILTDGNGNADIFLLPGTTYLFSISKTGYITTYGTWTPSTAAFTKTFKITAEDVNITTVTFGDLITFTGEWITANNTLKIYFNDKDDNTTDVTFNVYESYGTNLTLTNTTTFGNITTVTLYFSGLNTSRMHQIRLEMNHTKLGHILNQTIYVSPIRDDDRAKESWLESIISAVMGDFDYGYVVFALIYCPCLFLIVSLGAVKQPGFGVLCAGLYIILVTWRVESNSAFLFALSSLLILFGIIMIIVKHGKKLTGRET